MELSHDFSEFIGYFVRRRRSHAHFSRDDTVVQLGCEPQRIDLLTFISGVEFDDAWGNHVDLEISGLSPTLHLRCNT